jgi:O-antigen ligase
MLIITVAGVAWLGGDQLSTGVETATIELSHENTAHEGTRRSDIWRATWRMARAHPLAGAGLGGFWAELPQYHDGSGTSTPQQAHNDYLELLASGGLVAAAILIWFVVSLLRSARSAFQQEPGFQRGAALGSILGLIGIAVQSLVEFGLHVTSNALVLMMLLAILSLPRIDQQPIAQAHRNPAFN